MTYYEISNRDSGHIMGIWEGDTPAEAIEAMLDDAGAPLGPSSADLVARELDVTAKVEAYGEDTTVPDNPGAVDATIYQAGREVGEVTLLPEGGRLSTWGPSMATWASYDLIQWVSDDENIRRDQIRMIVDAVCAVVKAEKKDG